MMPRKKTAEDGETPKARKKKDATENQAAPENTTLEPDPSDLEEDTIHLSGSLADDGVVSEDELEMDDEAVSGTEIQLGLLTAQVEDLARLIAEMSGKLAQLENAIRSGQDRPRREFQSRDDRPRDDRPRRDFGDRPPRDFDRPRREFQPRDDRPRRDFGDRPPRDGSRDGGPRREFQPRDDRPKRDFGSRDGGGRDGGSRGFGRDNRSSDTRGGGFSRGFDRGDSRPRPENRSDSRPPRDDIRPRPENRGDSGDRGFGRRKDHGFGGVSVTRRRRDEE